MKTKKISSNEVTGLETSQSSGSVGSLKMSWGDSTLREEVRLTFCVNEMISGLVSSLRYYRDCKGHIDLPEDFSSRCLDYLNELCDTNQLTLGCLLRELNKSNP